MKKLLLVVFLLFAGCSVKSTNFERVSEANKDAALALVKRAHLKKNDVVIVTTLANINDLSKSSQIGRVLSEQISSAFVNEGIKVKELKFSNNIFIKRKNGEFILSRDIKDLAKKVDVNYVVVGTYATTKDYIYVNIKIIDPCTDLIIASTDYTVSYNSLLEKI